MLSESQSVVHLREYSSTHKTLEYPLTNDISGGNIAAALVLEAACMFRTYKPILLLLIVPVIDNNAAPHRGWTNLNAPWLTPARMLWCRNMYIQRDHGREDWQLSPNLAPKKLLARCPRTWIAVSEHDLLCHEGLLFAQRLRESGVQAVSRVYQGSTHSILALNGQLEQVTIGQRSLTLLLGYDAFRSIPKPQLIHSSVLAKGRELMLDAANALNEAFRPPKTWVAYQPDGTSQLTPPYTID